jgi:hypothetical protein
MTTLLDPLRSEVAAILEAHGIAQRVRTAVGNAFVDFLAEHDGLCELDVTMLERRGRIEPKWEVRR